MSARTTFPKEALLREAVCDADVFVTGNTGIDAFYKFFNQTNSITDNVSILKIIQEFKEIRTIILITTHRRENFPSIPEIYRAMKTISKLGGENVLIVLPVHPNPNVKHVALQELSGLNNVKIIESISFDVFAHLIVLADIIVTDSGGIQEEAANIGKLVVLMRSIAERPEGIYLGTIKQVGTHHEEMAKCCSISVHNKDKILLPKLFIQETSGLMKESGQ